MPAISIKMEGVAILEAPQILVQLRGTTPVKIVSKSVILEIVPKPVVVALQNEVGAKHVWMECCEEILGTNLVNTAWPGCKSCGFQT